MNIGLIDSMISAALLRRNLKRQRLAPSRKLLSWSALLASAVAPALLGAEVARWEAAETSKANGLQLERAADSDWHIEKSDNWYVARLKPSNDYYTRGAFHLSAGSNAGGKLWLVIEFLDRGYGLITVSPGVAQTKQWGVARVNTGGIRRA